MKFEDYRKTREVISEVKLYNKSSICHSSSGKDALYIQIPDKLRREMCLSRYNEKDLKVIICRKYDKK